MAAVCATIFVVPVKSQIQCVATVSEFYEQIAGGGSVVEVCQNLTLNSLVNIDRNLTIRSANPAESVTLTRGVIGDLFTVSATLILEDIIIDGNKNGGIADAGGALVKVYGGSLIMNTGAVVCNNRKADASYEASGGVFVENGYLNMFGGKISGNTGGGFGGGGVAVVNSIFNMISGEISGNNDNSNIYWGGGGGVYVYNSEFYMLGGKISDNTSTYGGGVRVYNHTSVFIMAGGEISSNIATNSGGGVSVWGNAIFTMNAGEIIDNKAINYGGGVYVSGGDGEFTMNGGEISGNTASLLGGGGVYVSGNDGEFTMNGGEISGNTTGGFGGGGVFVWGSSTFNMTDGKIIGNTAENDGGGVLVRDAEFTMSNGEVSGNIAERDGGGVYVIDGSKFTMTGGKINGNTAERDGGGVCISNAEFTITNGKISNNIAERDGGGAAVGVNGILRLGGTSLIIGNTKDNGAANNVFLAAGRYITLGTGMGAGGNGVAVPVAGMEIGIAKNADNGVIVQTGAKESEQTYFFADGASKIVIRDGVQMVIVTLATGIIDVPAEIIAGSPLVLTGTVVPFDATNRIITWSVVNAGTTGAAVNGSNVLTTSDTGAVVVRATIVNGILDGVNFTKDFTITVNPPHIPVTNIMGVPAETNAGILLVLTGTVAPVNSTFKAIIWSVVDAGTTGAIINGNGLNALAAGTVVVRATIINGISDGINYTKDFTIAVNTAVNVYTVKDLIYDLSPVIYNGMPQRIPVSGITGFGAITVKYNGQTSEPINAGTYAITVDIAGSASYSTVTGLALGDFTIKPKPLSVVALSLPPGGMIFYTGLEITPQVRVMDGSKTLMQDIDYTVVYADNVSVGSSASVKVVGIGNYTGEAFVTFEITKGREAMLFAGPSPVRSGNIVNFFWQGYNFGSGVLRIYDNMGNLVNKVDVSDKVFDNFDKRRIGSWDLTNRNGRFIARGTYVVKGVFTTVDGRKEAVSLIIGVM